MGKQWKQWLTLFFASPGSLQMVTAAMKLKDAYSLEGKYDQPRQHIKKQRHYFANKGPSSKGYGFFSDHLWMWELDYKESWVPKNWCFWTMVLEKSLESPLDCREIQLVYPKDQSWVFIGRTDVEAETPILWPPEAKGWLIGTDPDAGKDWGQEEKGTTEDEMAGWHYWLNGHGFWVNSGSWWWAGRPGVLWFMGSQSRTWLSDWTETFFKCSFIETGIKMKIIEEERNNLSQVNMFEERIILPYLPCIPPCLSNLPTSSLFLQYTEHSSASSFCTCCFL